MQTARDAALAIWRQGRFTVPVSTTALRRLLRQYGLRVCPFPMDSLHEVILGDRLYLSAALACCERRWVKAHALGHRLLHSGNQFWLECQSRDAWHGSHQERQAETFAGYLLLGDLAWVARRGCLERWQIAEEAGVPEYRLAEWIGLVLSTRSVLSALQAGGGRQGADSLRAE